MFVLALRYGQGGMSPVDRGLMALAGAGVIGWILAGDPIVALGCVVAADLIAFGLTAPNVHRDPNPETLSTYALASVGGGLAAVAVDRGAAHA